jgi:general secretion pathway protein G
MRKEGGFTLLELLIVIVIIGILALLIIPNITSAPKKARDTQRKTDLRAVQKGLEEYFVSNNAYPVVATAGVADSVLTALSAGTTPIMKTVPTDPKNAAPYQYGYVSADGTTYTLTGCLENGGDNGTNTQVASQAVISGCTTRSFVLANNN